MVCLAERRCIISSLWMLVAVCGSYICCWHILGWDVPVLCKLGVWFGGHVECFCGGRLKSCLLSVQSC